MSAGLRYFHDNEGTQPKIPLDDLTTVVGPLGPYSTAAVTTTASATTPRAVLSWKPNPDLTAYATYGQGFRSGFPQDYLTQAKFPAAAPDKLTNYELGIKGELFDHKFAYTAAGYYIRWTGVQQGISVQANDNVTWAVVLNGKSASGPGAEFAFTARPITGLELTSAFSWNDLTYDRTIYSGGTPIFYAGNRLNLSPEFTANFSTTYAFAMGGSGLKGEVSASENYTSVLYSVYVLPSGPSNGASNSVLIPRARFSVLTPEHLNITLYADNFSNYYGALVNNGPAFEARPTPRTIGLKVEYHYR